MGVRYSRSPCTPGFCWYIPLAYSGSDDFCGFQVEIGAGFLHKRSAYISIQPVTVEVLINPSSLSLERINLYRFYIESHVQSTTKPKLYFLTICSKSLQIFKTTPSFHLVPVSVFWFTEIEKWLLLLLNRTFAFDDWTSRLLNYRRWLRPRLLPIHIKIIRPRSPQNSPSQTRQLCCLRKAWTILSHMVQRISEWSVCGSASR